MSQQLGVERRETVDELLPRSAPETARLGTRRVKFTRHAVDQIVERVAERAAGPRRREAQNDSLEMRRRGRDYVARWHSPQRLTRLLAQAFVELDEGASHETAEEIRELGRPSRA